MLGQYGYIGIFLLFAIGFPVVALLTAYIVRVRSKSTSGSKYDTYECGMETIGPTWVQFNTRYYLYALIFVIFDIETIFLFPWAVRFKQLALFGFLEMIIFIAILLVGYIYAWKKHALEWR